MDGSLEPDHGPVSDNKHRDPFFMTACDDNVIQLNVFPDCNPNVAFDPWYTVWKGKTLSALETSRSKYWGIYEPV